MYVSLFTFFLWWILWVKWFESISLSFNIKFLRWELFIFLSMEDFQNLGRGIFQRSQVKIRFWWEWSTLQLILLTLTSFKEDMEWEKKDSQFQGSKAQELLRKLKINGWLGNMFQLWLPCRMGLTLLILFRAGKTFWSGINKKTLRI